MNFIKYEGNTYRLTDRQMDVFRCLPFGHTNKEIAKIIKMSPNNVNNYIVVMKTRFDITTKKELINIALDNMPNN